MIDLLSLYRLRHGRKISSLRLFVYVLFGYAVSGIFHFEIFVVNTVIILGGLLFASLLNDYVDHLRLGEDNAVGRALERKELTKTSVAALIIVPFLISLASFFFLLMMPVTRLALILLWSSFFFSLFYSMPPFRLKPRKVIGIFIPPIGIFLLFLEGLVLIQMPDATGWMLAGIVFLFAWYLEFLHLVDDSLTSHEVLKVRRAVSMRWLRTVPIAGILASILFTLSNLLFAISIVAWSLRLYVVHHIRPEEIVAARKSVLHPIWRLEEFVLYAAAGVLRMVV